MKFIKVSVFRRIMVVFIFAMILLYAFSIILYVRSVNSLKNRLTESIYITENIYIKSMEQDIMFLNKQKFLSTMKQDWSLLSTKRGYINNYDTLQVVLYAQERLQAIRNSSLYIDDVSAHFPSWGRTLSAKSGLMDFKTDEFNNVRMPLAAEGAQFVYYDDGIYLTSAYKYKYPVTFSIVLKLDMQEIALSLSKLNILNKSYSMLVKSDTGKLLAISSDKVPSKALEVINKLNEVHGNFNLNIDDTKYICVYDSSKYLGFTVVNLMPATELYKSLSIYYVLIWLFSAVVILTIVIYIYYIHKTIGKPMHVLINAFKQMEKGNFGVRVKSNINSDFDMLYDSFNHMTEHIQHLIDEVYEKEILVQGANLKQLQTQINPHFLYNSFYILHRMIKLGDNENAELFSSYLGKYFKYITRNAMDEMPLSMEVEHARAYADIMAIRLGDIVSIEFDKIPEKFTNLKVPRLMLQPLLENAFEHGIKGVLREGLIQVHFNETNGDLIITIEDNGVGMAFEQLTKINEQLSNTTTNGEITGMLNIHRRLKLMYGEGYGLLISAGKLEGTRITLRLKNIRRD